ncbi:MAG: hypothetical protein K8F24_07190, partial [Bacteroidales bacterium]|nr:hypothetical protein [Bacteroidales bacterium]
SYDRLQQGSESAKFINSFAASYHAANQQDHDSIIALKASGKPDIWSAVYQHFNAMNSRYSLAKKLPKSVVSQMNINTIDVEDEMKAAKNKAEQYYFTLASVLLQSNQKTDALAAFENLAALKNLNRSYPGLDAAMRKALLKSANQVLIGFRNSSGVLLPDGFAEKVLAFNLDSLPAGFPQVDLQPRTAKQYDYRLIIQLNDIDISPEKREEVKFVEKNNRAEAQITDYSLSKSATLSGQLSFVFSPENREVYTAPFDVSSVFSYNFARATGNEKAYSAATAELVDRPALPFPADHSLVNDAAIKLNNTIALMLGL